MSNYAESKYRNVKWNAKWQSFVIIVLTIVATMIVLVSSDFANAASDPYADPAESALPPSDMVLDLKRTTLVVVDP